MSLVDLYNTYDGKTYRYDELPKNYRKSADTFWVDEAEITGYDLNKHLYGCFEIPMGVLVELVMQTDGIKDSYSTFEEYHRDYIGVDFEDVSDYTEQWACILGEPEEGDEIIYDGWHRFHKYYQQKREKVPCLIVLSR